MHRAIFTLLFFFVQLIIKSPMFRGSRIDASYGAMVMAIGIFLIGVAPQFDIPFVITAYVVDFSLFATWLFLIASFMGAAFKGVFRKRYLMHPVQSFAVGTWVAATSILCLVLYHQYPFSQKILFTVALLNTGLWAFYLFLCIKSYKVIFSAKYYERIHGIVFLSTVSTQSLIIVFNTLFDHPLLPYISLVAIFIGLTLYFINFALMMIRLRSFQQHQLSDGWKNTNCIVHGAMSITGLASITSGAIPPSVIFLMWIWAAALFVIIEGIELWRLAARLNKYTLNEAIGRYHVSQWARNFTFGTFYIFTLTIDLSRYHSALLHIQHIVVESGVHVLISLLLIETFLFFKDVMPWQESLEHVVQKRRAS
ncbi:hypothetical protein [Domibacillus mangrovi]|uniref:Uncharacterized protein n=1 Tax=Domibacillus mangrovi TaxID=1714354 RepID=A0A1Q5P0J6_9BACI|nr:hypothetical protein [Domibacillus mangrovi]OKL35698.1 hypothetical protein BLL40_14040 [Domibacillus mangrovi]